MAVFDGAAVAQIALPPALAGGFLRAWSWPVLPLLTLLAIAAIYLRGWSLARRTRPCELPSWRMACFLAGIAALWIAIASPIHALEDYLLAAHMIEHFALMSVAPPLLVLGAPTVPLLRGLPRWLIREPLHVLFASRLVHRAWRFLTHPAVIWLAMNLCFLGWHVPAAFERTFRSGLVHDLEHLCFLLTSVAFWWVVLQPWPSRSRWPRWAMIPYLLSADLVNTILSAMLSFAGRVFYPTYARAPRISTLTPLQDQVAAGSEMWVLNSIVYLIPAVVLTVRLLSPKGLRPELSRVRPTR